MKRALLASFLLTTPALAIDEQHEAKARAMADRAIAYLRAQQDEKTGGWAIPPEGPHYPAITGLIVNGMLMHDGVTIDDPAVNSAVAYLLSKQQPDGGIYDRILPSY